MEFCRGSKDDYDRWAQVAEDDSWTWENLFPLMLKIDRITPPADGHNTTGMFDPSLHGDGTYFCLWQRPQRGSRKTPLIAWQEFSRLVCLDSP